jgi:DNA-binding transcriptional regulator LsrR (DeoR family)
VSTTAPAPPDLSTQVARLFFDRQMSKVEIAAHLGISRFRVARLIDAALADGRVRIEYRDAPVEDRALSTALEERFGLDLAAVADVPPDTAPLGPVARLAGAVVDGLIGPSEVIGIAWGSTMAAVVREIPSRTATAIEVVQLAGSSRRLGRDEDAGSLTRTLADRLGGLDHPLYAPAFVADPAVRDALVADPEVARTIERFRDLTLAIVGIGAMATPGGEPSSSLLRSGALTTAEIDALAAGGAVGDLVVHPFDAEGRFLDTGLRQRAVAIDIGVLRATPRVVAIAVGTAKAAAIRAALRSGVVRMLVTDRATARAVLVADGGTT